MLGRKESNILRGRGRESAGQSRPSGLDVELEQERLCGVKWSRCLPCLHRQVEPGRAGPGPGFPSMPSLWQVLHLIWFGSGDFLALPTSECVNAGRSFRGGNGGRASLQPNDTEVNREQPDTHFWFPTLPKTRRHATRVRLQDLRDRSEQRCVEQACPGNTGGVGVGGESV